MSERFLDDYRGPLREAPKPHRHPTWVERWGWWAVPAGLSFGMAMGAAYAGMAWTAGGFVFAAVGLCWFGAAVGDGR